MVEKISLKDQIANYVKSGELNHTIVGAMVTYDNPSEIHDANVDKFAKTIADLVEGAKSYDKKMKKNNVKD